MVFTEIALVKLNETQTKTKVLHLQRGLAGVGVVLPGMEGNKEG